jgi:hypothetical protein
MLAMTGGGCWSARHGTTGGSASFGNGSHLDSYAVYEGDELVPVCHVLCAAVGAAARSILGFTTGAEVTFALGAIGERHAAARGGGSRFDLDDGHIFVIAVERTGSIRVSQGLRLEGERQPSEILAAVKKAFPDDRWVQALTPDAATPAQPHALRQAGQPIASSTSSIVATRRQVYIGVSRRVYLDDSVSRSSCTRSRNSDGWSASKATTKS